MKPILLLFFLASCIEYFESDEILGTYVPIGYKNSFDTIQLKPEGVYHRKVYDITNELLLETDGRWSLLNKSQIKLNGFYQNLDDDLVKFPYLVKDTNMEIITNIETQNGHLQFCIGYFDGENCYRKLK